MEYRRKGFFYYIFAPFRWVRFLVICTGALAWLALLGFAGLTGWFFYSLPNVVDSGFEGIKTDAKLLVSKRLGKSELIHFEWVGINEINRDLIYTIVLSEDSQYFEHDGINYQSAFSALLTNLKKQEVQYGGSTITQQVAKNVFLDSSRTFGRKLKEYFISRDLEANLSKNEIIEVYLNIAEFGPGIYGVASASRYYFNKMPKNVNAAEGAYLALMLPSPRRNHYAIYQNKNISYKKRKKIRRVLKDMMLSEFISEQVYKEYLKYDYFAGNRNKSSRSPASIAVPKVKTK